MHVLLSKNPDDTMKIGRNFAEKSKKGRVYFLRGDLGSGKTTFVKGFVQAFAISPGIVKSPTYTYKREYQANSCRIIHYDFYRIESADDLITHEILSEINPHNIILVEWPEKIGEIIPIKKIYYIDFEYLKKDERRITFH